ncbi:helix-turn-helix transcriptional regulator [Rhodanobacter ginsengiterrae]|uniref:helix-turn-helix transcriptional regulator n=1 Tax=Rhodanobacter ginsengiterrae TaxID=2008451 RepID=UPI003CF4FC45
MLQGVFGERLGRSFDLGDPPTVLSSTPGGQALAATEIRFDPAGEGCRAPLGNDDGYLVGLQFRALRRHELWLDGAPVPVQPFERGCSCIYDLKRDPVAWLGDPVHSLNFYVPCQALSELADELGQPACNELRQEPGRFVDDTVIDCLGQCLLPALHGEHRGNQLFVDHVLLAVRHHLASSYGGMRSACHVIQGGLAAWQQRKAKELMREHLVDGIALVELAQACRLSTSAFVRGFRKSIGMPPHQWLLQRRIDRAMELMRDRSMQLADVALSSGFADQSHFTRSFGRRMGRSPGAWRRDCAA